MKIQPTLNSAGSLLALALIAFGVSCCSTSRQQPEATSSVTNTAPPSAAPATTVAAKTKSAKHATRPSEPSSKSTSAVVLSETHRADLKEIAMGQMAQARASTDEVREYANQLVNDRTSIDQQVVAIAQKKNVHLPDKTPKPGSEAAKLNSLSGPSFDRYFLQQTAAGNDKLVLSLKKEREDASDEDIEALIDKILPILEQDQELTQVLMKKEQA